MAPNPHTPTTALPWQRSSGESREGVYHIRDAEGRRVCFAYDPVTETLIVAAVNERAALLVCMEGRGVRIGELLAERDRLREVLRGLLRRWGQASMDTQHGADDDCSPSAGRRGREAMSAPTMTPLCTNCGAPVVACWLPDGDPDRAHCGGAHHNDATGTPANERCHREPTGPHTSPLSDPRD